MKKIRVRHRGRWQHMTVASDYSPTYTVQGEIEGYVFLAEYGGPLYIRLPNLKLDKIGKPRFFNF